MQQDVTALTEGKRGNPIRFLRDLVHYRTYAKTLPNGKKESVSEVIDRVKHMHQKRFYHLLDDEIEEAFRWVYSRHVVPSMRGMQFAGSAILKSNSRLYNCSYAALTSWRDFSDIFWLLMNGVGAGYSVQSRHISQLPSPSLQGNTIFAIPDTREGWADSIFMLLENPEVQFEYDQIRPRGARLSSGGTASGPQSLMQAHEQVRHILLPAALSGRKLKSLEVHDIMCLLADVVVVGGVRRAALISLFDVDDFDMLTCKHGSWWLSHPYRARANNSAVIDRNSAFFEEDLSRVLQMCLDSGCGEPGMILTNDKDYGVNPCSEISLKDGGKCNLSEVNVAMCSSPSEFLDAVESATIIGTLQAAYTDFSYIQDKWKANCEEEALLGVSITGQAQNWDLLSEPQLLRQAAALAVHTNEKWAKKLGINAAARITCTKPSGSTSAWLGTTSGIHAAHAPWYLRRVRIDRKDEFGQYLISRYGEAEANSGEFIESDKFSPENIVVTIPVEMTGAIQREQESAIELLERAKFIYENWILLGHRRGPNTHNISLTVNYREDEKEDIKRWMLENVDSWSGISLLPFDGGTYEQTPFEAISEAEYHAWLEKVPHDIDLSEITFQAGLDEERQLGEAACSGPHGCEIR